MNKAKIIKFTEKHALIVARKNAFDTNGTVGYVKKDPIADLEEGAEFDLPEGWHIVQKTDAEGKTLVTTTGEPLSFFAW